MTEQRDRIIRYAPLSNGLLSKLDREKNILTIDPQRRTALSKVAQMRLDCSDADATRLVEIHGMPHFEEC